MTDEEQNAEIGRNVTETEHSSLADNARLNDIHYHPSWPPGAQLGDEHEWPEVAPPPTNVDEWLALYETTGEPIVLTEEERKRIDQRLRANSPYIRLGGD